MVPSNRCATQILGVFGGSYHESDTGTPREQGGPPDPVEAPPGMGLPGCATAAAAAQPGRLRGGDTKTSRSGRPAGVMHRYLTTHLPCDRNPEHGGDGRSPPDGLALA
jgi:hypothetical protein